MPDPVRIKCSCGSVLERVYDFERFDEAKANKAFDKALAEFVSEHHDCRRAEKPPAYCEAKT